MSNKHKNTNKINITTFKNKTMGNHPFLSKILKAFELTLALTSLIVSVVSLCISCSMQSEINTFTESMGKVNYELSIKQTPETISLKDFPDYVSQESNETNDEVYYTLTPFIITKNKEDFSGDFGKCYFATVNNKDIDIAEFNEDFYGRYFNNGCLIDMFDRSSDDVFNFFYSPGPSSHWSIFHIIIQGYNGEKIYYTMVCSCKNNKHKVDCELFNNENIYDRDKVNNFISDTTLNITTNELIEIIEKERNLLKEKLS